jgi:integrase
VIASTEQTSAGTREKETKSGRCRTVAMPQMLVDELRRHRLAQAQELLRLGIRISGDSYVVAQADGQPYQPRALSQAVRYFMRARGIKVRLHGLRHSHASHMLAAGVHPKVAQERLGHSSIAITMDIYSHVMPNMQADAAARVDEALRAAMPKTT